MLNYDTWKRSKASTLKPINAIKYTQNAIMTTCTKKPKIT